MKSQSMTGYGAGEFGGVKFEIRSTNHKNLYVQVNIPSYLYFYETEIRALVKKKIQRGAIEIFFSKVKPHNVKVDINLPLAREYFQSLVSLRNELSITETVGINVLAQQKELFTLQEQEVQIPVLRKALEHALRALTETRMKEGKYLTDDISRRIRTLHKSINRLEKRRATFIKNAKRMMTEKLREFLNDAHIDESRIVQEVAIMVERTDITEEIVRIKSHLDHFGKVLKREHVVGKKTGFIAQELFRELNTIGSKSADVEISTLIIQMKHELEKIREQIQNLQ
jgi:uncharacterized protein (TIGR00255 family)